MTALTTPIPIVPGTDVTFQVLRLAGTQVLTVTGTPTGGTLNLTYRGNTAPIPYNATAAQIKALLEKLAYIGINNVTVTGGALPGTAITITPTGTLLASVFTASPMIADPTNLTGGTTPSATIAVPVKDITGLTYHLESRYNPGSVTPDIDITSAGTAQGSITNGTTTGIITVAVLKTATAALNFGLALPPALPLSHFVLVEINGAVLTPIVTGDFALYPPTFI